MKKNLILMAILVLILVVFVACDADKAVEKKLYGRWQHKEESTVAELIFDKDGYLTRNTYEDGEKVDSWTYEWSVSGSDIVIKVGPFISKEAFVLDGNKLTIAEITYLKV